MWQLQDVFTVVGPVILRTRADYAAVIAYLSTITLLIEGFQNMLQVIKTLDFPG